MTIEEKAKRYDEAIEIAKKINNEQRAQPFNVMTRVFPELAESEDERIRKAISQCVEDMRGQFEKLYSVHHKDAIAWLEKLGEQKPTDKVEPKFKVGYWVFIEEVIGYKNGPFQIKTVDSFGYSFDEYHTIPFIHEDVLSKWTIQDAKDGDVLVAENGWTCIFKELEGKKFSSFCFMDSGCNFYEGSEGHTTDERICGKMYPATKEQRDLLFQKMKEAGYEWDAAKKELKKIEQKPAEWSEEDESNRKSAIMLLRYPITICNEVNNDTRIKAINWLKSLEDKYISQLKQDWSEKDEERRKKIIHILSLDGRIKNEELSDINDWLKSLRPQSTWKPSDEQMEALRKAEATIGVNHVVLAGLISDLEKLTE